MRRVVSLILVGLLVFGAFPVFAVDSDAVNVAVDKPAFGNVPQDGYEAWRAVDGDTDTCYRAKPVNQNNRVYRLVVDLGETCPVVKIGVRPPKGDTEALRNTAVYGATEPSFSDKVLLSTLSAPADTMNDIEVEPADYRYIVLEKPTNGAAKFGVAELEVYSDTQVSAQFGRMVKVSEHRTVSGTAGYGGMNGKHQTVFDGDDTTGWASTNAGSVSWVFVDLEGEYEIPYVTLSSGSGSGGQLRYRKDLRIVAANDMDDIKNNSADVLSMHVGVLAPDMANRNTDLRLFVTDEAYIGKKYRYVGVSREPTLSTNGNGAMESYMDIDEVCVYTPAEEMQTDYVAVSVGKSGSNMQLSGYVLSGGEESGAAILAVYDASGAFLGAAMDELALNPYGQTNVSCTMDFSSIPNADSIASGTLALVRSADDLSIKKLICGVGNDAVAVEKPDIPASAGKASLAFSDEALELTGTTDAQTVFALACAPSEEETAESVLYAGMLKPMTDGTFHLSCPLPKNPLPGIYTVQLGYDVSGSSDTLTIYRASEQEEAGVVAAMQTVTASTFMEIFNQYHKLFAELEQDVNASADSIGASYLPAADAVRRGLVSEQMISLNSSDALSVAISTALVLDAALHDGAFEERVAAYGDQMPLIFGKDYNAKRFAAVIPAVKKAVAVTDGASATTLLRRIAGLSLIYEGSYTERAAALEQYGDVLGISNNTIPPDIDVLSVAKKLGNMLADIERYANGMDSVVKNIVQELKPNKSPGGGSSGGGSSGGGGNSGRIGKVTVPPVETKSPASFITPETEKSTFSDIESVAWAKQAIEALARRNIVTGDEAGRFEPSRAVAREEAVKMLVLAAGMSSSKSAATEFTDCAADGWYMPYLNVAVATGLVTGKDDGSFGLGELLTREDLAVLVYRALNEEGKASDAATGFSDFNEVSDYASEAVTSLAGLGLLAGMPDGRFAPKDAVTRAQAAVIFERMLTKIEEGRI